MIPCPPTRRAVRVALALALASAAAGCTTVARWRVARANGADALERRGVRIVGARAIDRDLVALRAGCEHEGTPRAECRLDGLRVLYDRHGYQLARFALRRIADRDGHAMHELVVDEGPLFATALKIDGLGELPEAPSWTEALPLRTGDPFSRVLLGQAGEELLAAARGAGFGDAEVFERIDPEFSPGPTGTLTLTARLDVFLGRRGERWRVGAVEVDDDLDSARRASIARELARLLHPGDPFDYARVGAARARLREYPTAEVRLGDPDEARHEIPVLVRVWVFPR